MCVIFCTDDENPVRPTPEMVEQAFDHNGAGAGIAWRRGGTLDEKGQMHGGEICWSKGLELPAIQTLVKNAPLPFVCHFRIPTVGGKRPDLCHPFPIHKSVPLYLEGTTPGYVLFHNGHWSSWKDMIVRAAISGNAPIPEGEWSDSRALAWIADICGLRVLEFVDEKVVAISPTDVEIFGNGWSKHQGVWVSNQLFLPTRSTFGAGNGTNYERTYCIFSRCTRKDINTAGYCPEHSKSPAVRNCKATGCLHYPNETGYCFEHSRDRDKQVIEGVVVGRPSAPKDDNAGNTADGGGPAADTPFRPGTQETPLQLACRTFSEAQRQFKAGKLSKNKWKKARKLWEKANEKFSQQIRQNTLDQQTLH